MQRGRFGRRTRRPALPGGDAAHEPFEVELLLFAKASLGRHCCLVRAQTHSTKANAIVLCSMRANWQPEVRVGNKMRLNKWMAIQTRSQPQQLCPKLPHRNRLKPKHG